MPIRTPLRSTVTALVLLGTALVGAAPVAALHHVGGAAAPRGTGAGAAAAERRCEIQLQEAVAGFDAAFAARDLDTYMSYYADDARQVDSQGTVYEGTEAIETFVAAVMRNDYRFEATVLSTDVDRCLSATVLESTRFTIPAAGVDLPLIDGVAWVRTRGAWKVTLVQNTLISAP